MKVKGKLNKTNLILSILLVISASLLIYSIVNIKNWKKDNDSTEEEINSIYKTVSVDEVSDGETVNSKNQKKESIYWSYIKMNMITVDFTDLIKQNKDTKGWIQVNGTNINYPFVQSNDNAYYLNHSFNKKKNEAGWVFLDYRNDINNLSKNNIIYAHSRLDKTMFGSLKNITKSSWFNNTNNYVIKIATEKSNTLWEVFSVYHIPTTSDYLQISFNSDEEFLDFANKLKERSYHKFNTNIYKTDKIITLSTCFNDNEKVVMHARLIKIQNKNA